MKLTLQLAAIAFIITLIGLKPDTSRAQTSSGAGGNFGIGVMVGEPTGVSVKSWTSDRSAFGVGAAWSLSGRNESLHLHLDYLHHSWFSNVDSGRLAFYYGIGGRIIFADDPEVGIRVPLGLNYIIGGVPLDLFVEAVPILDLTPDTNLSGNGAFGIRYYF